MYLYNLTGQIRVALAHCDKKITNYRDSCYKAIKITVPILFC